MYIHINELIITKSFKWNDVRFTIRITSSVGNYFNKGFNINLRSHTLNTGEWSESTDSVSANF